MISKLKLSENTSNLMFLGKKYILDEKNQSLKRYDEENKIWIRIKFSKDETGIKNDLMDILSKEYLNKATST